MKRRLRCQVNKGMFSDELAVTYQAREGLKKSVFVPTRYVLQHSGTAPSGEPHEGEVEVDVFEKNGAWWAVLPNDRKDIVWIDQKDLVGP
jgi:hypothetical protein